MSRSTIEVPEWVWKLAQNHFKCSDPSAYLREEVLCQWACNVQAENYVKERAKGSSLDNSCLEQNEEIEIAKVSRALERSHLKIEEAPRLNNVQEMKKVICCPVCEQMEEDPDALDFGIFAGFKRGGSELRIPLCLEHAKTVKKIFRNQVREERVKEEKALSGNSN